MLFDDSHISSYIESRLVDIVFPIYKNSVSWNFRCPICGDSKKSQRKRRGNYYPNNAMYICYNDPECSAAGLNIIAKMTNTSFSEVYKDFLNYATKSQSTFFAKKPRSTQEIGAKTCNKPVVVPSNWREISPKIVNYLNQRKIYEAPNAPMNWHFYHDIEKDRLVIPWASDNGFTYYQERAIHEWQSPKYLFPFDTIKEVFGLSTLDESWPYIMVMEGAFDSIWVKNGTAIGGLLPTSYQKSILSQRFGETVMFFDNQRVDKSAKMATEKIAKNNAKLKLFIWPKMFVAKDVNEHITSTGSNPFFDEDFLISHTFTGIRALLELTSF